MKKTTKNRLLFGAILAVLPLLVVSCLYFENNNQPSQAAPNTDLDYTIGLRVEAQTNDKGRLVFAMLVPKAWNLAQNATLSITTLDYSQNKLHADEVVDEELVPMPAEETDPKTEKPWSEAFMQVVGQNTNDGSVEMEWVVWRSETDFEIWDKDDSGASLNPVHATMRIRFRTGSDPVNCMIGYAYCYDTYGLSSSDGRHGSEFKSISTEVFSTTPKTFRYGDIFGVTFLHSSTALSDADEIYLCGTAVHDGGQRTELVVGEKNRMNLIDGHFEKYLYPKDFFGLPADAVIEELYFYFSNADGSITVGKDAPFFVEQSAE